MKIGYVSSLTQSLLPHGVSPSTSPRKTEQTNLFSELKMIEDVDSILNAEEWKTCGTFE